MAFLFADSFEGVTSGSDLANRGWTVSGTSIETTTVKDGNRCARMDGSETLLYNFSSAKSVLFVSFWFRYDHNAGTEYQICRWKDTGAENMRLRLSTSNTVHFENAAGTQLGSSSSTIAKDTWYHFEIKMVFADSISADSVILKIDGTEEINLAATTDTSWFGGTTISDFELQGSTTVSENHYFDSVVIWDAVAGDNFNDFVGMIRMEVIKPTGNGAASNFVGSDADSTDNYLHVDETPGLHDGDTSYTESSTATNRDLYSFGDLTGSIASIVGVQSIVTAKKTDTDARGIKSVARISSTDYLGAEHTLTNGTYVTYNHFWDDSPASATAWTESEVNAAEFGIQVST